jgi:type II secretory pathway component PulL
MVCLRRKLSNIIRKPAVLTVDLFVPLETLIFLSVQYNKYASNKELLAF